MNISKSKQGKWNCLRLEKRLDTMTSPTFEQVGLECIEQNSCIALDFSTLEYISSAGLRALLVLAKKAKTQNAELVLCAPHGMVMEVLEESGIKDFFTIYETTTMLL